MATPIKAVPILSGEIAEEFIRKAEENERKPRHELSEVQKRSIQQIVRQMQEYVPSWRR